MARHLHAIGDDQVSLTAASMHALDLTWRHQNKLLALLDEDDFFHLSPMLRPVEVAARSTLVTQGERIRHVDFPCSSVYSAFVVMTDGSSVETGTTGNEGMTCLNALFDGITAPATVMCQISGVSLRIALDDFQWEVERNLRFRTMLNLYAQAYFSQLHQSVACNKLHSLEQRAARWLLMTHDRAQQDELPLTQEFLAIMLGAHRPTVSLLARKLEQAGAISYSRGTVRILRRDILESASCECYRASRTHYARLLGLPVG